MDLKTLAIIAGFIIIGILILFAFASIYPPPAPSNHFPPTGIVPDSSGGECTSGAKIKCMDSGGCPGTKTCMHGSWASCISPRECTPGDTEFCASGTCKSGVQTCNSCGQWGPCVPQ